MKIVWLSAAVVLLAGCATTKDHSSQHSGHSSEGKAYTFSGSGPIAITTTTSMIADLARNIGGDRVAAQGLMGPGVDPHLYKATPGDMRKLKDADMVFYNGLHLEGKMGDILEKVGSTKPVVAVAENISKETLLKKDATTQFPDPHIWFDVSLWMKAGEAVREALVKFDPPGAKVYRDNADRYMKELAALHKYAAEQVATIPKPRRVLITAHDAFNYFGRAYDVEVKGLQGISTAGEASVKDVQNLVQLITQRGIKAVFVESSVSHKSIQAVVQGARSRGQSVSIGGQLYSDAMGKPGTPEGTYPGMVRHNVDTIVKALK